MNNTHVHKRCGICDWCNLTADQGETRSFVLDTYTNQYHCDVCCSAITEVILEAIDMDYDPEMEYEQYWQEGPEEGEEKEDGYRPSDPPKETPVAPSPDRLKGIVPDKGGHGW